METTLPQSETDKALHLLKLAKLHSRCSLDFGIELQAAIMECKDPGYLLANLEPILTASIRNLQTSQIQLRSIRRQKIRPPY